MFQWWPTSDLLLPKPAVQHTSNILVCHYLIFFFVLFCHISELIGPHRFFINTFWKQFSLAFKLVLQNNFHGLSCTVVTLFSSQCVFLNYVLRLTASLKTLAIYPPPPPPPPKKKNMVSVFSLVWSYHQSQNNNNWFSFLLSCITWQ